MADKKGTSLQTFENKPKISRKAKNNGRTRISVLPFFRWCTFRDSNPGPTD